MKFKFYSILGIFFLSLGFAVAGGLDEDPNESKDYDGIELTTREDIADFQDEQEKLYEKVDEILSAQGNNCNGEDNVVKWSGGCVTWSGGYQQDGEITDNFVRYGS